jgi:predicted Zn-dependent protease
MLADLEPRFGEAEAMWLGNGNYLPSLFALADAYEKRKRPADAASIYQRILDQTPDHLSARLSFARMLAESGDPAKSLEQLELSARRNSDSAMVMRLLGEAREAAGDLAGALEAYRRAGKLTRDPEQLRLLRRAARRAGGDL